MKRGADNELKDLLEERFRQYALPRFVETDPVSIPHRYSEKQDIEISGFLAATISWGNRASILKNAGLLMAMMDDSPFQFVTGHSKQDLLKLKKFVHRTFNGTDCVYFIKALRHIWEQHGGLEAAFHVSGNATLRERIRHFRELFFSIPHPPRTQKHVSDPSKKSTAKRICMFLRWMVRPEKEGIDFGIWKNMDPADLMLPLDVHSGGVSRKLGLLSRKQNDWQAVEEVTAALRRFDPRDPVKYDIALFAMGVNKEVF